MSWKIKRLLLGALLIGRLGSASAQQSPASDESTLANDPCLIDSICRAHFQRGRKFSKEDNYTEALAAYEAAHLRREVPWLLINIGRTLHKLGRPAESLSYYQRYLAAEPSGPPERKQRAEKFQQEATEEIEKIGALRQQEPAPAMLEPPAPPEKPAAVIDARAPVVLAPPPTPAPPKPGRPVWLGAGLGAGGAALLVSAGVGVAALVQATSARNAVYVGAPTTSALDAQKSARALGIATDVLLGVGVVAIGATAVTYLVKSRKKEPRRVALLPGFSIGIRSAAIGLSGSY